MSDRQAMGSDVHWMQAALEQAELAGAAGEVPVGAVIVHRGELLAAAGNAPIALNDPSAHAEMRALRQAAQQLGNYRLEDCELFVTLEPCAMCAGALLQARLKRVVFAVPEPKTGAAGSVVDLFALPLLNHHTRVEQGLLAESCQRTLQSFFKQRRRAHKQLREAQALRQDALRTAEERFSPWQPAGFETCYWADLPELQGLRLHALRRASGVDTAAPVVLCLHGPKEWSLAWVDWLPQSNWRDANWLCPDLIGFGRSDKPKRGAQHTLDWHARVLWAWLQHLKVSTLHILCHPDMLPLGQHLAVLAGSSVVQLSVQDLPTLSPAARAAPFPDRGHQAGPRAFQKLLAASTRPAS